MLQVFYVLTVVVGSSIQQIGPTAKPSLQACIDEGAKAVDAAAIDLADPDGVHALGFSCVLREPPQEGRGNDIRGRFQ